MSIRRKKFVTAEPQYRPVQLIPLSFAAVIAAGTLFLMLPISSANDTPTGFVDALFTATSATCVTGLVVVDTALHWSLFGQWIILLLIQVGGLGLVTLVSFFNLMLRKRLGLKSMLLAGESVNSLGFENVLSLVKVIVTLSLIVETIGAILLSFIFVPQFGPSGFFISIFMSVSSFCNAGFDLLGFTTPYASLTGYTQSPAVLLIIMALIITGGLGFAVWSNLLEFRKKKRLTLHSKVVLLTTLGLIIIGTFGVLIFEWSNPNTIGTMNFGDKVMNSAFASVSSRTAGFNTIDNAAMTGATKILHCALMFIGAAPGSTGGGIKVTTTMVIFMTVICVLKGDDDTIILNRHVGRRAVYKAMAICFLGALACGLCSSLILYSFGSAGIPIQGVDAVFESISAFGTVGLSVGITTHAPVLSKLFLISTMFLGRVGPVSLAIAFASRPRRNARLILPEGKIMVG